MNIVLRPGKPSDAESCGTICFKAFKAIADQHNFPPDFPAPEAGIDFMNYLLSADKVYSVVAEVDGKIAGSNFLWEQQHVAGVGPITVDPSLQNVSVGKKLMEAVLQRVADKQLASVRLVQAAYHTRSFSLYSKLGFDVKEPLSVMQGAAMNISFPGYTVRAITENDISACNELCAAVHGMDRGAEITGAIHGGTALLVEFEGKVAGYTTCIGYFGHTVAASNTALKALIGASPVFAGPGFLLPSRNSDVLRWCLQNGLRVVQPFTLMSKGLYNEPAGAFLPSILY